MGPTENSTIFPSQFNRPNSTLPDSIIFVEITVYDYIALFFTILRAFIAVVGFFANLLVIFSVLYFERLRVACNYFVANLAILDATTLFIIFTFFIPRSIPKFLDHKFDPICWVAKVSNTVYIMSLVALILISIDRYIYIVKPLNYENFKRRWFLVTFLSMATCATLHGLAGAFMMCRDEADDPIETIYNFGNTTISVAWFITIIAIYSSIFKTAYVQSKATQSYVQMTQRASMNVNPNTIRIDSNQPLTSSRTNSSAEPGNTFTKTQSRIIFGYSLIVGFTTLTFIILTCLTTAYAIDPSLGLRAPSGWFILKTVAHIQVTLNAAVNPFIYAATQKVYRKAFMSVLQCRCDRNSRRAVCLGPNEATGRVNIDIDVE
ncbi:alpha-1B adrenergic receptor-like [Convolutriloba macropyga]|uniref:alpha-1B adrenergic receptor-like n=1 Tax=Convolutriloba macropyga TaxID=536237 RepID=UPI003F51CCFB